MFTIFARSKAQDKSDGFEEVSEKKTTVLGYFLLVVMFLFLVGIGQTIFGDLTRLVAVPTPPSSCIRNLSPEQLKSFTCSGVGCACSFGMVDTQFGIDIAYRDIEQSILDIASINERIYQGRTTEQTIVREINTAERQYELALQEKIANEQVLLEREKIQATIAAKREEYKDFLAQRAMAEHERDVLIAQIKTQVEEIQALYTEAQQYYERQKELQKFKVFGLSLLFVLPLLYVTTRKYFKLKRASSPHTIIVVPIVAAVAILFLQVTLTFLYLILPMQLLSELFARIINIPGARFLVYYGVVALVIGVFGGIVYAIQKRAFHSTRITKRRLKKCECPRCAHRISDIARFCANCGIAIRKSCTNCGKDCTVFLTYCEHCGHKKEE